MAHITADRVKDTSTTAGTGTFTVSGTAPTGYRTFSTVCATNDTLWYCIAHQTANEWEVGYGTYSAANQITRTTVLSSSNSGSAVDFSAGTKDVFLTLAAGRTQINVQTFNANGTWTKPAGYSPDGRVLIQAWGAGGSGGRNATSTSCSGGGGGGYNERWVTLSDMGGTETITIGAGGASRTGSDQNGATGGNTTVGSLLTAYGGGGGASGAGFAGGSGGGQLGAGTIATGTTSPSPGRPFIGVGDGNNPASTAALRQGSSPSLAGFTSSVLAANIHGGGGGIASATTANNAGCDSVWGGAGGGGHNTGAGGTSSFGGNGGAAGTTGTAGSQPGGGGGAGTSTSGAGGDGRVIITVFPA